MLQINQGSNPLSKLEVVSSLNVLNSALGMYGYSSNTRPERYYPKLYLATIQTTGINWISDTQTYAGSDIKIPENWPINDPAKRRSVDNHITFLFPKNEKKLFSGNKMFIILKMEGIKWN